MNFCFFRFITLKYIFTSSGEFIEKIQVCSLVIKECKIILFFQGSMLFQKVFLFDYGDNKVA